eukprot:2590239-Amphidinium_carterae.1
MHMRCYLGTAPTDRLLMSRHTVRNERRDWAQKQNMSCEYKHYIQVIYMSMMPPLEYASTSDFGSLRHTNKIQLSFTRRRKWRYL